MIIPIKKKVTGIHKSQMNRVRWVLVLECKHEVVWTTIGPRPALKAITCFECSAVDDKKNYGSN